jgi:chitinase
MFLSLFILSFFILAAVAKQPITPRQLALTASGSDTYTCGPGSPCTNGACCGDSGWCGYGETYCGDGCQSNCDAKAECGEFAEDPEASCPLNVCCSEFGFCGTTEEFCKDGCQSNCEQPAPDGSPSNTQERVIGYWEAWNSDRPCGRQSIGEIPVEYLTHLYVSFAYISTDFKITNMDDIATSVYRDVGAVKQRNPNVKLVIALGGWTFSDPGPWQDVFPTMVSTKENRATFIKNLLGFLSYYGYDGVGKRIIVPPSCKEFSLIET